MNVGLMRQVDRFVGTPLCWLAGIASTLFSKKASSPHRLKSVLVIKFFGMGSILLATPFLSKLKAQGCEIVFLSFESNRELLERLPQPSRILTISTRSVWRFVSDTIAILRIVRRSPFDAVFDLEFFSKFSTLLASLSNAPVRTGYELPAYWRRLNLTNPVSLDHSAHAADVFLKQLEQFGNPHVAPSPVTRLESSLAERTTMERKLGLQQNGFTVVTINVNAGATSLERRWAPERFAQVVRALQQQNKAIRFFFTGTADEYPYVERLLHQSTDIRAHSTNCAGILSLGELIALCERSALFLTNDSGPMHIAASIGTPVIALFGPESPKFYGPTGNVRVVYKAIACSPCLNVYNAKLFVCPYDARCMKEISTHEVLEAIGALLPSLQPQPA